MNTSTLMLILLIVVILGGFILTHFFIKKENFSNMLLNGQSMLRGQSIIQPEVSMLEITEDGELVTNYIIDNIVYDKRVSKVFFKDVERIDVFYKEVFVIKSDGTKIRWHDKRMHDGKFLLLPTGEFIRFSKRNN